MWIITDKENMIQDKSSHKENLSRGYMVAGVAVGDAAALMAAGFKKYEITDKTVSMKIFDHYDGHQHRPNIKNRAEEELRGLRHEIIEVSLRKDKALDLDFTEEKFRLEAEIAELYARKTTVKEVIAKCE